MDAQVAGHFADVVARASATFENVEYSTDTTPERSLLRLQADYGRYRILVVELFSDRVRKYRYYVLLDFRAAMRQVLTRMLWLDLLEL